MTDSGNLAAVLQDLERRREDATRMQSTAPVAEVLATVIKDLRTVAAAPRALSPAPADDQLLTAAMVAKRLNCSRRHVYANASTWPFTRYIGPNVVRFCPVGLTRWIDTSRR